MSKVSFQQLLHVFSVSNQFSCELANALRYHVARRLQRQGLTDPELSKAVLSQIFLKLAQMQQQQSPFMQSVSTRAESSVVAYLNRMIQTAVADYFRAQEPTESYDALTEAEDRDGYCFHGSLSATWQAAARQTDHEDIALIQDAMQQLTPRQRLLCARYYFDGVKLEALKEQVGLSLTMVHKELKKSVAILRRILGVDLSAQG